MIRKMYRFVSLVLLCSLLVGCNGSVEAPRPDEDAGQIVELVYAISAARDEEEFKNLFKSPTGPNSPHSKYQDTPCEIQPATVKVDGDWGNAKVDVYDDSGTLSGTLEWTFAKVDGQWKIEHAPLE